MIRRDTIRQDIKKARAGIHYQLSTKTQYHQRHIVCIVLYVPGYQIHLPPYQSRSAKPVHCRLTAKDLARTEPHGHGDGEGHATRCSRMTKMKETLVCTDTALLRKERVKGWSWSLYSSQSPFRELWIGDFDLKIQSEWSNRSHQQRRGIARPSLVDPSYSAT